MSNRIAFPFGSSIGYSSSGSGEVTATQLETRYVNETGDTMEGVLNMGGNKIINLGNPTSSTDAIT